MVVHYAYGDADIVIVNNAIVPSKNCTTTVIGKDKDLLILFLYHTKNYKFK